MTAIEKLIVRLENRAKHCPNTYEEVIPTHALLAELKCAAKDAKLRRMVEAMPDGWLLQYWLYDDEETPRWYVFKERVSDGGYRADGATPEAALEAAYKAAGVEPDSETPQTTRCGEAQGAASLKDIPIVVDERMPPNTFALVGKVDVVVVELDTGEITEVSP